MSFSSLVRDANPITRIGFALVALVLVASSLLIGDGVLAAPAVGVHLSVEQVAPRKVEEQTEKAIIRDYGAAWTALAMAMDQNRPEQLGDLWIGFARQNLTAAIQQQKQSGLRIRYSDDTHNLNAFFYSPEGSALELQDTAHLRQQLLDGNSIVSSEDLTVHYLVVMTPTVDHWQIRVLQSVPGF